MKQDSDIPDAIQNGAGFRMFGKRGVLKLQYVKGGVTAGLVPATRMRRNDSNLNEMPAVFLFRRTTIVAALGLLAMMLAPPVRGASETLGRARVAGIQVQGLSPRQARQQVARQLAPKLDLKLVLTDGTKRVTRTRRELGVEIDAERMIAHAKAGQKVVPLQFVVNQHTLRSGLRQIASKFATPARNAGIVERHGAIKIVSGQSARTIDVEASAKRLAALLEAHGAARVLPLVMDKKTPQVSAADLKGITGRLSRFSTTFNPNGQKRAHNIRVAVSGLNGKVVPPGTVFSLNETIGERTHQHGYLTARVIVNGKMVPGIGGGVSQVAGTLFNAVLLAGLPIVEYRTHAHPVPYIPIGRDATLAWQHIDLKFKNNTRAPLYIAYVASGSHAVATIYGAKIAGQRVTLSVPFKQLGPRRITAVLYRTVKKNGKLVRKEKIGRSDYDWKPDYSE